MKLRNLFAAISAASLAYLAVSRKEEIAKEVKETTKILADIQTSKTEIHNQLTIIQSFQQPLQEMTQDLQYKLRVYKQSIAGNLEEIQKIQAKYQVEEQMGNASPATEKSDLQS